MAHTNPDKALARQRVYLALWVAALSLYVLGLGWRPEASLFVMLFTAVGCAWVALGEANGADASPRQTTWFSLGPWLSGLPGLVIYENLFSRSAGDPTADIVARNVRLAMAACLSSIVLAVLSTWFVRT